jgi:nitroreductase
VNSSDVLQGLIRGRRSVRKFRDEPVDKAILAKLVEPAAWAPSAGNRQDWLFTIVTSDDQKRTMADAVRRRWDEIIAANRERGFIEEVRRYAVTFSDFERAPAVVVIAARKADAVQRHMLGDAAAATSGSFASAAMAAQNMMLAAHALGLGSCCMTGALAAREELGRSLGIGRRMEIVCLIAIGWPDEAPCAPDRKPLEEVVRYVE